MLTLIYRLPGHQIQRLQRVWNTAVRILAKTKKNEHISPVIKSLQWLPIKTKFESKKNKLQIVLGVSHAL
jgi:hypothetical protein